MLGCWVKSGEPRHEPEIAMARLLMDATLGDPGYGQRYSVQLARRGWRSELEMIVAGGALSARGHRHVSRCGLTASAA